MINHSVAFAVVLFCVLPSFVAVAQCSAQLRNRSDHPGTPHGDLLAGGAGAPGQGTGILDAGWINRDRRSERQKTPPPNPRNPFDVLIHGVFRARRSFYSRSFCGFFGYIVEILRSGCRCSGRFVPLARAARGDRPRLREGAADDGLGCGVSLLGSPHPCGGMQVRTTDTLTRTSTRSHTQAHVCTRTCQRALVSLHSLSWAPLLSVLQCPATCSPLTVLSCPVLPCPATCCDVHSAGWKDDPDFSRRRRRGGRASAAAAAAVAAPRP